MHDHDHEHHEHHQHGGHHAHTAGANRRRLGLVLAITAVYMVAEFIGGILTNSLALLSDAGHMLTDVAALALALFALWFSQRPATPRKTYGFYRLEILAAFFNGLILLGLSGYIIYDAILRFRTHEHVHGAGLLGIALGGLVVNLVGAYILQHGHAHSLNVRAAFYHLLGDLFGSVGAVAAGILIVVYQWYLADPILAIAISLLIIVNAVGLVRDAADVLLEAVPPHIDLEEIRGALMQVKGVVGIHDLHVWTITSGMYALSCHVVVIPDAFTIAKLEEIRHRLHDQCDIPHQTIQLETDELAAEEEIHV
jgi:cobalt-zinc-cadmium efflux system protein